MKEHMHTSPLPPTSRIVPQVRLRSLATSAAGALELQVEKAFSALTSVTALIHQFPVWSVLQPKLTPYFTEITPKVRKKVKKV
jgi:hypothetical protein